DAWLAWCERLQSLKKWERALLAYQEAAKGVAVASRSKRIRLASGFRGVARGLQDQRKYADCVGAHRQAALLLEQVIAEPPAAADVSSLKNDLASVCAYLGLALEQLKQREEAVAASAKAVALWTQLRQADPGNEWYAHEEACFSSGLAVLL